MSVVAAVDCGTNSTRLLVAGPDGALERRLRITRLGQGVDASGRLAPEAIARTVDALREFRGVIEAHGAGAVRAVATSAARDAENRDELFDAAEEALGARPELLGGDEEGRLSFAGATAALDPADGPFLVVDIGGGSTELAVGTTEPVGAVSLDVGCVRLTEQHLRADPPAPEELSAAVTVVRAHLKDVERLMPAVTTARRLVGLAGTVTTMAAVEIGLETYDRDRVHHFELTRAAAEDVFRTLATERLADRRHNPGLDPGRADVIVGGAAILVTVMRQWGFDTCLVSEDDILDALVAGLRRERTA